MAQPSTAVISDLPAVGLFPLNLPADGPSIQIMEIENTNSYLIAYDRNTWTVDQIHGWASMRFGAYETVELDEAGA